MSVYRFKVWFEEYEEVYREIEIKSTQTFEDFHFMILQSVGFDTIHNASFFISDDYWRKGEEITYQLSDENETAKRKKEIQEPKREMKRCKMALLIDDPHQKFVYVYDPTVLWTFMIELIKILPDDVTITYPRISKKVDDAPKQYNLVVLPVVNEDEDFEEDEPMVDDDEAYNAKDDEDVAELELEEADEEETEEETDMEDMGNEDFGEQVEED